MEITEVKVKIADRKDDRVKGFATMTFDDSFVVRDVRIIEGRSGLFVAMPSRPMKESCGKCGYRNPIKNKFCARCGASLNFPLPQDEKDAHRDIAHPINQEMRQRIQDKVIEEYEKGLSATGAPPVEEVTEQKDEERTVGEEEVKLTPEVEEEKGVEEKEEEVVEEAKEEGEPEEPKEEEKEEEELEGLEEEKKEEEQEELKEDEGEGEEEEEEEEKKEE